MYKHESYHNQNIQDYNILLFCKLINVIKAFLSVPIYLILLDSYLHQKLIVWCYVYASEDLRICGRCENMRECIPSITITLRKRHCLKGIV